MVVSSLYSYNIATVIEKSILKKTIQRQKNAIQRQVIETG